MCEDVVVYSSGRTVNAVSTSGSCGYRLSLMLDGMRGALAIAGVSLSFVAGSVMGCESGDSGGGGGAGFDSGSFSPDGSTTEDDGGTGADGDTPLDGGAEAEAPAHYDLYVDPVNGLDTNDGSLAHPFHTLTHVGTVATSGQVIGLLDGAFHEGSPVGTCDGRGVTVPGGLTFRSVHPRAAKIANISFGQTSGSLTLIDIAIDGSPFGACTGIVSKATDPGATITASGVSFVNGGHFVLGGNVKAVVMPGSLGAANMVGTVSASDNSPELAELSDAAELVFQGGLYDFGVTNTQCGAIGIQMGGTSKVTFDGATVKNTGGQFVNANVSSTVTLQNNTLFDHVAKTPGCRPAINLGSQPTLIVKNSTIQGSGDAAVGFSPGESGQVSPVNVTVTNSKLIGGTRGISTVSGFAVGAINMTVSGTQITGATQEAVRLVPDADFPMNVSFSNCTITGNASGIYFAVPPSGGSLAISGTTIQNTGAGLTLLGAGTLTTTAHGNTWNPNVQGADAAGHYADGTLVTSANAAGTNYNVITGSTLDL